MQKEQKMQKKQELQQKTQKKGNHSMRAMVGILAGLTVLTTLPMKPVQASETAVNGYAETATLNAGDAQSEILKDGQAKLVLDANGKLTIYGAVPREDYIGFEQKEKVISVVAADHAVLPENCEKLFKGYRNCISIDLTKVNTANVTNMYGMFFECYALESLDVSKFNTENVTDMEYMFYDCDNLMSLDVSKFNTANVKNMTYMFCGCAKLTGLDVSGFNTAKVTDMNAMFASCRELDSLDVSGFNTANVTDMGHMFADCLNLDNLDVSGFKTDKVTNMRYMFDGCSDLTNLDVSNFNTANVTDMKAMFNTCKKLNSLDLTSFNTEKVKDMGSMFAFTRFGNLDLSSFTVNDKTNVKWMMSESRIRHLTLGSGIKKIDENFELDNGTSGWYRGDNKADIISGDGEYAVFTNSGTNTYHKVTKLKGSLTISYKDMVCGEEIEAKVSFEKCPGAVAAYQWQRNGVTIPGATNQTYVLDQDDVGKIIYCVVSDKTGVYEGELRDLVFETVRKQDSPAEPTGFVVVAASTKSAADGQIKGVSSKMEYATKEDFSDAKACKGWTIIGLKTGYYYIRYAESGTAKVGKPATVYVGYGPVATATPTTAPTAKPSATPTATAKPTAKPSATPAATVKPTTKPSATPAATVKPTTKPSATPAATAKPTTKPSATPAATVKPTTKPSATPAATVKPTTKPTTAPTTKPVTEVFTDIKATAWYVKAVQYVYDKGIMSGKGTDFQPGTPVTRGEFAQTLYNHIGKPAVSASVINPFPDVKAGKWYTSAVLWAKDKEIVKGYANGKFGVGDKITREQLAQILYKYAKLRGYDLSATNKASEGYLDSNKRSDWAYTALDWAVSQGIISGKGTSGAPKSQLKLDPKGNATRAECAQMVMKLLQKNGL